VGIKVIEAKIVLDSISHAGVRLTTFVLTYPRFIHAEFLTHRVFSRNASSSRAIPVKKQIQMVIDNPAIPLEFRKNQKGMQAGEALANQQEAIALWLNARDEAVKMAQKMADMEIHKQYANRILEPYAHITVVCTATDFNNFYALRCHEAAQPEIHQLANLMYEAQKNSIPTMLHKNEWHLPFMDAESIKETKEFCRVNEGHGIRITLIKRSVARCARVSYLTHEGKGPSVEQDLELYERLVGSAPVHASPAEHQATPLEDKKEHSGNFRGWEQYRKTLSNENIKTFKKE